LVSWFSRILHGLSGADDTGAPARVETQGAAALSEQTQAARARVNALLDADRSEHRVVAGNPEQAEADDQHPGDRAGPERDVERRPQSRRRSLRGAHIRAHRHVHADVAGGGALIYMGVYSTANLVAILGKVDSVTARMTTVDKPTALEDTATLILEFANGALATAETGWCDPARSSYLRVHGTAGKFVLRGDAIDYIRPSSYEREWAAPLIDEIVPAPVPNQHEEWRSCIENGEQPKISNLWMARHVSEIMLAAVRSNADGGRVAIHSAPRIN